MNYKAYGIKASTTSRMARKHMRRDVFVSNRKMAKAQRKAARLERKSQLSEQSE